MNLFDKLVTEAISNQPDVAPLRMVVEKELLHHDILKTLSEHGLLKHLTFIGGTCLRACYGGIRLSEDLDFAGGRDFTRHSLSNMGEILTQHLHEKYGLKVVVSEPIKETKNVATWKMKIETRPKEKNMPAQRININICQVPSYEKQPMLLLNPYGIDMGTNGLVIQAQTREEIYTDKLLAFALRPNRLKFRDLWDIVWLHQRQIKPNFNLIPKKIQDRDMSINYFFACFNQRRRLLSEDSKLAAGFKNEMQRFLPRQQLDQAVEDNQLWSFIIYLITNLEKQLAI